MKRLLLVLSIVGISALGQKVEPPLSGGGGGGGASPAGPKDSVNCSNVATFEVCPFTGDVSVSLSATTVVGLNGVNLAGLASGLLKNTAGTGVPSIAVGSDVCGLLTLTGPVTSSASCATAMGKADLIQAPNFCQDAGSTNAYACNLSPAISAYVTGTTYTFKANTANGGGGTINLNSLGAKTLVKLSGGSGGGNITSTLDAGDIIAGQWVSCIYDGTNCQITSRLGQLGSAGASSSADISFGSFRNSGAGSSELTFASASGGAFNFGVNNSGGTHWANGIGRGGMIMSGQPLQLGAGFATLSHTIFGNGNERISTTAATDLGGNSTLQIDGGVSTYGEIIRGTKFTTSGCSVSATAGGATGGTYTSGTTGACTVVVTMAGATGFTAPAGFVCSADDLTTPANLQSQSASSTTTATITGTTVSGDVVAFHCHGY